MKYNNNNDNYNNDLFIIINLHECNLYNNCKIFMIIISVVKRIMVRSKYLKNIVLF